MTGTELKTINITDDGGVQKKILKEGTGTETPVQGCEVSLHYTGRLTDGTVFDSSVESGEPFKFTLGKKQVIRAFDLGIATMKLGEKCDLICAPEYAYGENGSIPSIPPNATLIFTLEMLGWRGEDISPNNDGGIERFILVNSTKKRTPTSGALCKAHITGKFDCRTFEEREVEFDLGEGSDIGLIEGVELAIEKMTVGEESRFKIHSQYAFGAKGNEEFQIPPNADVEYTIKLIDCEKGINDWNITDEDREKLSRGYKEKGTKYFKKENWALALKMYKQCVKLVEHKMQECPESFEIKKKYKELVVAAYSNQALCCQKMHDHFDGIQACNEVLKLEPDNIKALYRRGQCNLAISEFNEALEDFERVLKLEPTNKAAQNQIQICKQKIKDVYNKEKKIYANMFTKLAEADKEQDTKDEQDVMEKCGEWTDEDTKRAEGGDLDKCSEEWTEEDTKREVDRAFERDNNIVMI